MRKTHDIMPGEYSPESDETWYTRIHNDVEDHMNNLQPEDWGEILSEYLTAEEARSLSEAVQYEDRDTMYNIVTRCYVAYEKYLLRAMMDNQ